MATYTPPGNQNAATATAGTPIHIRPQPAASQGLVATVSGTPQYVQLLVGAGFTVSIYDIVNTNTLLDVIPNPETVTFEDDLSDVGSGQVTVATPDVPSTMYAKDYIWRISWEGVERFGFIAEQIQDDSVAADQIHRYTIAGKGLAQWLNKLLVYPPTLGTPGPTRTFTNMSMAAIFQQLLHEAQARGAGTQIAQSVWNATIDSNGLSWTDVHTLQVNVGTDLLTLLNTFAEAAPFDWHMNSRFNLSLFRTMGQDRSSTVRLQPVGSVETATNTTDNTQLFDVILMQDANNNYAEQKDTPTITNWGRRELFTSSQNVVDATGRADFALALLNQMKVQQTQRVLTPTTTVVGRKPFVDYQLGDYIGAEFVDGTITKSRVLAIAMQGAADQTVEAAAVTLDFSMGNPPTAGTTGQSNPSYTGPVTVYGDNGANPITVGTSATPYITLQLIASTPTAVQGNVYIRGQSSIAQTMTAAIYVDGNLIRTMQQQMDPTQQTWCPCFYIPSLSQGTHSAQLRLNVDTGTFAIAAFDLQHWYAGNGLQGGVPAGSTLINVVDSLPVLSYPAITTHASISEQTPVPSGHVDSIVTPPAGVTTVFGTTPWLGYYRVVAAVGDDGDTSTGPSYSNTATALEVGNDGGTVWGFWIRFVIPAPGIPSGVTIRRAFFTGMPTETDTGLTGIIHAELAAGPAAPTSRADFLARTRTTNNAPWNVNPTVNVSVQSPDLTAVMQELVTNFGGSITAIQLFVEDNGSPLNGKMLIQSLNHASPVPAALTVMYS